MNELQVVHKGNQYQIRTIDENALICVVYNETLANALKTLIQHYGSIGNLYRFVKQLW